MSVLSHRMILGYKDKNNNDVECQRMISSDGTESSMIRINDSVFEESFQNGSQVLGCVLIDGVFYGYVNQLDTSETFSVNQNLPLNTNLEILNNVQNSPEFFDARMVLFMLKEKILNFNDFKYSGYQFHFIQEASYTKNGNLFNYCNYCQYSKDDYNYNTTRPTIQAKTEETFTFNEHRLSKQTDFIKDFNVTKIHNDGEDYCLVYSQYEVALKKRKNEPYIKKSHQTEIFLTPLKQLVLNPEMINFKHLKQCISSMNDNYNSPEMF